MSAVGFFSKWNVCLCISSVNKQRWWKKSYTTLRVNSIMSDCTYIKCSNENNCLLLFVTHCLWTTWWWPHWFCWPLHKTRRTQLENSGILHRRTLWDQRGNNLSCCPPIIYSDLFTHWWQRLTCMAPTCSSVAINHLGSMAPNTRAHADWTAIGSNLCFTILPKDTSTCKPPTFQLLDDSLVLLSHNRPTTKTIFNNVLLCLLHI